MKDIMAYDMDFFPDVTEFVYENDKKNYLKESFEVAEKKREESTNNIMGKLIHAIFATDIISKSLENSTVKVVLSDEAKTNLRNGTWKWMNAKDKDYFFRAIVVDKKGQTQEHALLKKDCLKGIDVGQIAVAMQGMAIQKQLTQISEQMIELTFGIDDLKAGQINDRVGLYYSAEFLYREAIRTNNSEMRNQMIVESLSVLNTAIEQIKQTTLQNLKKIDDKYKATHYRGVSPEMLDSQVNEIKNGFQVIHKAEALKTAIYCNCGEYKTAVYSLLGYKDFLVKSLEGSYKNAISYADRNYKDNFWEQRVKEFPDNIDKICKDLNYDNYYIECRHGRAL